MASKAQSAADEDFESLYRQLEETVTRLEQGGLTLEQSMEAYELGMKLAHRCQELLQKAELRITKLQESFADSLPSVHEDPVDYSPEVALPAEGDELRLA